MLNTSSDLQKLTDEFIQKFFDMAHASDVSEKANSDMPQLISDKRDDGFAFNHTLAKCIVDSQYAKNKDAKQTNYPLIGMGFVDNIIKGFFQNRISNFNDDMKFVLDNFKSQEQYSDWTFGDLKVTTASAEVEEVNVDAILGKDKSAPTFIKVWKTKKTHSFTARNAKNGYKGICKVIFLDNELQETHIYNHDGENLELVINDRGEPTIQNYKYVANINSFFNVLDQVVFGISTNNK